MRSCVALLSRRLMAVLLASTCLPMAAEAVDVANEAQLRSAIFAANTGDDSNLAG